MEPSLLLRNLSEDKFLSMFKQTPKQIREFIFSKLKFKNKPTPLMKISKPGEKSEKNSKDLYRFFLTQKNDEIADEIMRNYFLTKRELLKDALDYMKIPHKEGLTEHELDGFEKLSVEDAKKLCEHLTKAHDLNDVEMYLAYVKAPVTPTNSTLNSR